MYYLDQTFIIEPYTEQNRMIDQTFYEQILVKNILID